MKPLLITLAILLVILIGVLLFAAIFEDTMTAETTVDVTTAPIMLHSHSFDSWKTVKEPTCTEDGLSSRACKVCDETEIKTVPSPGHNWAFATCSLPKTCRTCNLTEGSPQEHDIVNGACTLCLTTFRTEDEVKQYLKIVNLSATLNADGGVNVDIGWENLSEKTVHYIHFDLLALDENGQAVACLQTGKSTATVSDSGSFSPNTLAYSIDPYGRYLKGHVTWQNVWYNDAVTQVKIDRIHVLYSDDTRVEFSTAEAEKAFGDMTLSTTVKELSIGTIYFHLDNMATEGILFRQTEELPISIISDKGYNIRKNGEVDVLVTSPQTGESIVAHTMVIDPGCYDEYNRLIVEVPFELDRMLVINVNVSLTFRFDGEAEPYILEKEGVLHARP